MTDVVIITPNDDRVARQVGGWGAISAKAFNVEVVVLRTRSQLDEPMQARHVIWFGHGLRDALVARRGRFRRQREALCDQGNLPKEGRIVVAVACSSGDGLGAALAETTRAVRAYVGWLDEMSFSRSGPDHIGNAIIDGVRALASGASVYQAVEIMRDGLERAHSEYRAAGNHLAQMQASYWKSRLFVGGDGNACMDEPLSS
ncbi:MAG: hypothetical protein QOF60_1914 [Actinomycetota bacterium]|nr:hypothetical protein [Actinomycetota bacterium]